MIMEREVSICTMMRVKVVISRNNKKDVRDGHEIFQAEGLVVDFTGRTVTVDGKRVEMSPKEYELLFYLVRNRNIALDREKLITEVWGYDYYGDDSVNSDLTLYAAYRQAEQLQPVENIVFAAAENVDGDSFAITVVTEDKKLDAEGVRAALDVKNLTDPGQTDIVRVTGADGEYVITGITPEIENNSSMAVPGFEDGCPHL